MNTDIVLILALIVIILTLMYVEICGIHDSIQYDYRPEKNIHFNRWYDVSMFEGTNLNLNETKSNSSFEGINIKEEGN